MAETDVTTSQIAFKTIVAFAGREVSEFSIKGRWVWGRPASSMGPGMIHIQVCPGDEIVTSLAMRTITGEDMRLGSTERRSVYRSRRVEIARRLNCEAVHQDDLKLLLKRDGTPTRLFSRFLRDWVTNKSA